MLKQGIRIHTQKSKYGTWGCKEKGELLRFCHRCKGYRPVQSFLSLLILFSSLSSGLSWGSCHFLTKVGRQYCSKIKFAILYVSDMNVYPQF